MSDSKQDKVTAFDTLFTNNHIQKLKILMTYLDSSMQKHMAIYIKYLELQYTIQFFRRYPYAATAPLPHESSMDFSQLCGELIPFCDDAQRTQMENMQNMFRTFENYKEMMEMVQMMKDMFPEGENPLNGMFPGMDLGQMFGSGASGDNTGGDSGNDRQPGTDRTVSSGNSGLSGNGQMPDMSQLFDMFQMFNAFKGGDSQDGSKQ